MKAKDKHVSRVNPGTVAHKESGGGGLWVVVRTHYTPIADVPIWSYVSGHETEADAQRAAAVYPEPWAKWYADHIIAPAISCHCGDIDCDRQHPDA